MIEDRSAYLTSAVLPMATRILRNAVAVVNLEKREFLHSLHYLKSDHC